MNIQTRFAGVAGACLLALASISAAQVSAQALSDPGDPNLQVPRSVYKSSLTDYRKHADPEVGSWKDANDRVGEIGGWRAYAREMQQGTPPAPGNANNPSPAGQGPAGARPGASANEHKH